MRISIIATLISSLLLCCSAQAQAAIRYVRQGATGAANGTDWTNAYTTLPGSLTRGDTYYVADGSYGSYTFDDPLSGTTLITVKKATVADHGTTTGWLDTFGDGQATFGSSIAFLTGFYVFDGQTRTSLTTGHGFKLDNSASGSTELVQFGQFGTPISTVTVKYLAVIGRGYGQTQVVDRVFFSNSPGTTNLTISYNYVIGAYVPFVTRGLNTMLVEHNYIADNNSTPASHAETWSDSATDNVTFRYNYVRNPEGSAMIFVGNGDGATAVDSNTSSNWNIYGNVIFQQNYSPAGGNNPGIAGLIYVATDGGNQNWADNWKIYNNTFYNISIGTSPARFFFENVSGVIKPVAKNNIWVNCASGANQHNNVTLDFNYYSNTPHGSETNMQVATSNPIVNAAGGDFHLVAATAGGLSLPSPYNLDMVGVTRASDGTWDRGAFEFGGTGPVPPAAPINLRIIP